MEGLKKRLLIYMLIVFCPFASMAEDDVQGLTFGKMLERGIAALPFI